MTKSFTELFVAARKVSVPIVIARTTDQIATINGLHLDAEAAKARETAGLAPIIDPAAPVLQWDRARGLYGLNKPGVAALKAAKVSPDNSSEFSDAMAIIAAIDTVGLVVFAQNAHRQLIVNGEPSALAIQSVANLREMFKVNWRMLVLLGPAGFVIPSELEQDVVVLDDALPGADVLGKVVTDIHDAARKQRPDYPLPTEDQTGKAVEALSGLSKFAAEQVVSMSLTEAGLDIDAMWERKRIAIEQTRGMRVWRGKERFSDLVGLAAIKAKLRRRLTARTPIGCVVFMDEIDKVLANVEHDTSGVRMDQLRTLLTTMEDQEWRGIVAVGVAGGGKSAIAKAFGNEAEVPTIQLDLGDMEAPHVGESEALMRNAIAVIKAIGRGNAFVIATSNNASVMRPELQRRFTEGMFFFDVMTAEERQAAWKFFMKKYELGPQALPDDEGWTGAEIRNACREAWDTGCSLRTAAEFIIPMAQSRAEDIEALRRGAHGKFLDASKPGKYLYRPEPMAAAVRGIQVPDMMGPLLGHVLTKES